MAQVTISNPSLISWSSYEEARQSAELEERIYRLVLGKVLPAIFLGLALSCTALTFVVSPLFLSGAIVFFPLAFSLYKIMSIEEQVFQGCVERPLNWQQGQPIGLVNRNNDCWANAAMQLSMHSAYIKNALSSDPVCRDMIGCYEASLEQQVAICPRALGAEIRARLYNLTSGLACSLEGTMEDPVVFFETMLGGRGGSLQYNRINGELSEIQHRVSFLDLRLSANSGFEQLLTHYFNYTDDLGRSNQRLFATAPPALLIQLGRFVPFLDDLGRQCSEKYCGDINLPMNLTIEAEKTLDGVAKDYAIKSFIVHLGRGMAGGHYIAYVQREGSWWCCNDQILTQVTLQQVQQALPQAYFICYE